VFSNFFIRPTPQGGGALQFNQPTGVAATAAHVWVTDRNNHRVLCFDAVSVVAGTPKLVVQIGVAGAKGNSNERFNWPWGIAVHAGHVFGTGDAVSTSAQTISTSIPSIYMNLPPKRSEFECATI
jgi:hypothetical protein